MNRLIFFLILFTTSSFAQGFKIGEGSVFEFSSKNGAKANLSIYITESSFNRLGIEYHFVPTSTLLKLPMWQQYILKMNPNAPLIIEEGYIYTQEMKKPQKMSNEFLHVNSGVQITDFLFAKKSEINKQKIADETVEIPAGRVKATHYQKITNGQTVDYWISEVARPIGLVKLVSEGKKSEHNYRVELKNLATNVKKKIDPKEATPLGPEGRAILKAPLK